MSKQPFPRQVSKHVNRGLTSRTRRASIESVEQRLAFSANVVVNSLLDNVNNALVQGPSVTLRQAINYESSNGGGTISFAPSIAGQTIKLGIDSNDLFGASAFAIKNGVTITIDGGASGMTITRDTAAAPTRLRFFYVAQGGSLSLNRLNITGGLAKGGDASWYKYGGGGAGLGGAIVNAGEVILNQTTLSDNVAHGGNLSKTMPVVYGGGGLGGDSNSTYQGGSIGPSNFGSGGAPNSDPPGFGGGGSAGNGSFGGGAAYGVYPGFGGGQQINAYPDFMGGGGAGLGGAIFNYGGDLSIINSTVANNSAIGGSGGYGVNDGQGLGGGVFNLNGAVTGRFATLANNIAANGGAIYNLGDNGIATQNGPELSLNVARTDLQSCILSGSNNGAATPSLVPDYYETKNDSALSGNHFVGQTFGTVDWSVIQTPAPEGHTFYASGAVANVDPNLGALADNGGPTKTMLVGPFSAAANTGHTVDGITADQRGHARSSLHPYAGAYEGLQNSLLVTTAVDEDDGVSDPTIGTGTSLREALHYAQTLSELRPVTFDGTVFANPTTIALTLGQIEITSGNIYVDGYGITLDAGQHSRVFQIDAGATVQLTDNMTFTNGSAPEGGAILNNGTLTLSSITISNSRATSGSGGAVLSNGTLSTYSSTFTNNVAADTGGAIGSTGGLFVSYTLFDHNQANLGGAINSASFNSTASINSAIFSHNTSTFNGGALRLFGSTTVNGCFFDGNSAFNAGGGVMNQGRLTLINSTFSNNSAAQGGGLQSFGGTALMQFDTFAYNTANDGGGVSLAIGANVTAINTIIAGNTALGAADIGGTLNAQSNHNLLNMTASAAKLDAPGQYGMVLPLPGSPAIAGATPIDGIDYDARFYSRHAIPDIGAIELERTAAVVTSLGYEYQSRQAININLATDGRLTFDRSQIDVQNLTTGQSISAGTLSFNATGIVATLLLINQLPDGNYRATAGGQTVDFFVLKGDFNHDRRVDFNDLVILAQNYGKSGRTFGQGDVNYDGIVDFNDLVALAQNYNAQLAAPPAAITRPGKAARGGGLLA